MSETGDQVFMPQYAPTSENRKLWCQGKVGNPHQFEFWYYHPRSKSIHGDDPYFAFQRQVCGRKRYCVDPEGTVEIESNESLNEEEWPEPPPAIGLIFRVTVEAVAEDWTHRRISDHSELYRQDADLKFLEKRLVEVAYEAFNTARNKIY